MTDPHVSAAAHFMRDHLGEEFGIKRVMEHVTVSRRTLHEQFQRFSVVRPTNTCAGSLERAKELLSSPERVKMRKIAIASGFSSAARMRLVFRRYDRGNATGIPSASRRNHRLEITGPE